ncbi:DUF732 domain-containing protein [Mycobacterium sp. 050134]|uniref:DUF732 domain-containing protein n=1 Tax=Mycobacterium sp. 050134 TaxID=3096111 RepID=UPI002ED7CE3D
MQYTGPLFAKFLLALLAAPMGIILAWPAYAEPGIDEPPNGDDAAFLSSLHQLGINFGDPSQAIGAAQSVCGLIQRGESGLEVLNDLRDQNPGLSTNSAAQFATVAAKHYCPRQLEPNDHGIK